MDMFTLNPLREAESSKMEEEDQEDDPLMVPAAPPRSTGKSLRFSMEDIVTLAPGDQSHERVSRGIPKRRPSLAGLHRTLSSYAPVDPNFNVRRPSVQDVNFSVRRPSVQADGPHDHEQSEFNAPFVPKLERLKSFSRRASITGKLGGAEQMTARHEQMVANLDRINQNRQKTARNRAEHAPLPAASELAGRSSGQVSTEDLLSHYLQAITNYEARVKSLHEIVEEKESDLALAAGMGQDLLEENQTLVQELELSEIQISELNSQLAQLDERLRDTMDMCEAALEEKSDMSENMELMREKLQTVHQSLSHHMSLEDHEDVLAEMEENLQNLINENKRLKEMATMHNTEMEKVEAQCRELSDNNEELRSDVAALSKAQQESEMEVLELRTRVATLQRQLDEQRRFEVASNRARAQSILTQGLVGTEVESVSHQDTSFQALLSSNAELLKERGENREEIQSLRSKLTVAEARIKQLAESLARAVLTDASVVVLEEQHYGPGAADPISSVGDRGLGDTTSPRNCSRRRLSVDSETGEEVGELSLMEELERAQEGPGETVGKNSPTALVSPELDEDVLQTDELVAKEVTGGVEQSVSGSATPSLTRKESSTVMSAARLRHAESTLNSLAENETIMREILGEGVMTRLKRAEDVLRRTSVVTTGVIPNGMSAEGAQEPILGPPADDPLVTEFRSPRRQMEDVERLRAEAELINARTALLREENKSRAALASQPEKQATEHEEPIAQPDPVSTNMPTIAESPRQPTENALITRDMQSHDYFNTQPPPAHGQVQETEVREYTMRVSRTTSMGATLWNDSQVLQLTNTYIDRITAATVARAAEFRSVPEPARLMQEANKMVDAVLIEASQMVGLSQPIYEILHETPTNPVMAGLVAAAKAQKECNGLARLLLLALFYGSQEDERVPVFFEENPEIKEKLMEETPQALHPIAELVGIAGGAISDGTIDAFMEMQAARRGSSVMDFFSCARSRGRKGSLL